MNSDFITFSSILLLDRNLFFLVTYRRYESGQKLRAKKVTLGILALHENNLLKLASNIKCKYTFNQNEKVLKA